MRTLKVTYTENGIYYPLEIDLPAFVPSPLIDGSLTMQGVVAVVDWAVTGIVR